MRNVRDIQGPALAIVLERLKSHEEYDTTKTIATGQTVKTNSKIGKPNGYGLKQGSRSVSLRAVSTKGSRPESIMSVQDINIESQALLNVKDYNKDERERELWLEQIQDLENDLMKFLREDLHRWLLSTDFKKQVDGIEMLQKALPSIGKEIIEVLYILLKWFVLRFCESNTSCLLKVLEFLPELLDTLRNENYTMNESEASIFLPCLVEKTGRNIEKLRELMKQIIHGYFAATTFPYILEDVVEEYKGNDDESNSCTRYVGCVYIRTHILYVKDGLMHKETMAADGRRYSFEIKYFTADRLSEFIPKLPVDFDLLLICDNCNKKTSISISVKDDTTVFKEDFTCECEVVGAIERTTPYEGVGNIWLEIFVTGPFTIDTDVVYPNSWDAYIEEEGVTRAITPDRYGNRILPHYVEGTHTGRVTIGNVLGLRLLIRGDDEEN